MGCTPFTPQSYSADGLHLALLNSYILDSGATEHVCNDRSRFIEFTPAAEDDILVAGNNPVKIEGYGTIKITLECEGTPDGKRPWLLYNVKYIPTFTTNTVSYNRFFDKQIYWDSEHMCLKYNG
jgi:hypothetical protein